MKLIKNNKNPDVVINLEGLSSFYKSIGTGPVTTFLIHFYEEYWEFSTELERDIIFDKISSLAENISNEAYEIKEFSVTEKDFISRNTKEFPNGSHSTFVTDWEPEIKSSTTLGSHTEKTSFQGSPFSSLQHLIDEMKEGILGAEVIEKPASILESNKRTLAIGDRVKILVDPSGACIEQSLIGTYGIILEIDKCGTLRVDDWWYAPTRLELAEPHKIGDKFEYISPKSPSFYTMQLSYTDLWKVGNVYEIRMIEKDRYWITTNFESILTGLADTVLNEEFQKLEAK